MKEEEELYMPSCVHCRKSGFKYNITNNLSSNSSRLCLGFGSFYSFIDHLVPSVASTKLNHNKVYQGLSLER